MRKTIIKILLIMISACQSVNVFADVKLKTEAEVAAYVDSITGFNDINDITKSFKRININDDNTPFLHKQINGRNVWVAEYKDFRLSIKSIPGKDKYNRDFKIYVDANDGTLLKITSKFEGNDPNLLPEPNAVFAEGQMKGENYLGFPKEQPKIRFLDALDTAMMETPSAPLVAKEINALYVWYSSSRRSGMEKPRRVWIIMTRGIPPMSITGHPDMSKEDFEKYESQNIYYRLILDADTGHALIGANYPKPEELFKLQDEKIKKTKANENKLN